MIFWAAELAQSAQRTRHDLDLLCRWLDLTFEYSLHSYDVFCITQNVNELRCRLQVQWTDILVPAKGMIKFYHIHNNTELALSNWLGPCLILVIVIPLVGYFLCTVPEHKDNILFDYFPPPRQQWSSGFTIYSMFYTRFYSVLYSRGDVPESFWISGESIQDNFWRELAQYGDFTAFQSMKVIHWCMKNKLRRFNSYP